VKQPPTKVPETEFRTQRERNWGKEGVRGEETHLEIKEKSTRGWLKALLLL